MSVAQEVASEYLSLGEAAGRAEVSRQAIYLWVKQERIPAYRMAGRLVVRTEDLDELSAQRTTRPRQVRRMTRREAATVLAALAHWQKAVPEIARAKSVFFEQHNPLDDKEIEKLHEEIAAGRVA